MISPVSNFNLVQILDWVLVLALFIYLVFAAVVIWQIRLLIFSIKTNLSTPLLILGVLNFLVSFLCLVAAVGLL